MAPRTAGGHCQGRAELRDDTSSAKAQTKGSPHSRKSNFIYQVLTPVQDLAVQLPTRALQTTRKQDKKN